MIPETDHRPRERLVSGADTAVLFIHGIAGTPRHFDRFVALLPEAWSYANLLLAGHGGSVAEFSAASMEQWRQQTTQALNRLRENHRQVLLVGHSMGTLLALELAADYADTVGGLFLLAVPLRWHLRLSAVTDSLKLVLGRPDETDVRAMAARRASSIRHTARLWHYVGWLPRFWELFGQMRRIRRLLPGLKTTAQVFQSGKDELVSRRSESLLHRQPWVTLNVLSHSSHYYYAPADLDILDRAFVAFCDGYCPALPNDG